MTTTLPHYTLRIYLGDTVDASTRDKYTSVARKRNKQMTAYHRDRSAMIDAGIDLFVPNNVNINNNTRSNKIDMGVVCSMSYHDSLGLIMPCGFYLYPRSSTGSKTPLRLSNSVGVIDAGYRGNIMACFDNIDPEERGEGGKGGLRLYYSVKANDRVVQICAANLIYPIAVEIVSAVESLEFDVECVNARGVGGFGSTGN
jgi:dUTP pyrophosphatase